MLKTISNFLSKIIQIMLLLNVLAGCMRVEPPENIKVNPNPQDKYIVTVHIDSDVEIKELKAIQSFHVVNIEECSPKDQGRSLGGSWNSIEKYIESKLLPVASNRFKTVYYPKMYLDESYYSMEVCRWKGFGIEYRFRKNNVLYDFSIKDSDITQSGQVSIQCESLKQNRHAGGSVYCKQFENTDYNLVNSYFEVTLDSKKISK